MSLPFRTQTNFFNHKEYGLVEYFAHSQSEGNIFNYYKDGEYHRATDFNDENFERANISSWPHLERSNPTLPYSFDLHYDYKTPEQVMRNPYSRDRSEIMETIESCKDQIPHWEDPEPGSYLAMMKEWYDGYVHSKVEKSEEFKNQIKSILECHLGTEKDLTDLTDEILIATSIFKVDKKDHISQIYLDDDGEPYINEES